MLVNVGEVELNNNGTDHFVMQDTTILSIQTAWITKNGSVDSNARTVGHNEVLFEDDLCDKCFTVFSLLSSKETKNITKQIDMFINYVKTRN